MIVKKTYSHLGGSEILSARFPDIDKEINEIISDVSPFKTKISKEKKNKGKHLYNPRELNDSFQANFASRRFREIRLDYKIPISKTKEISSYKQIDYNKSKVNVEVQFGKYAFMFYDMSKFQHFYNAGKIDVGVEIVPTYAMMREMSTGVSYGEQLEYDIERLNRSFPSVPVKIMMIEP